MKTKKLPMWFFFGLLAMAVLASTTVWSGPRNAAGRIVSLQGKVLVRNEDASSAKMREVKAGAKIYPGEVINTSSDASVKILFTDKSILDLGPSTLFKVDEYKLNRVKDRQASFTMKYGKVRALVTKKLNAKGKFRIRTKSATMGVRGTEFIVASDLNLAPASKNDGPNVKGRGPASAGNADSTKVTVVKGKVEVDTASKNGPSKKVALTKNQQITASTAVTRSGSEAVKVSKVVKLKPQMMKAIRQASKVVDQTFVKSVEIDKGKGFGGAETMALFADAIKNGGIGSDFIPNASDLNLPGTMGPRAFRGPPRLNQSLVPIKVRIQQ